MQPVNTIEKLREWFRGCPAILQHNRFRVDYLSDKPLEYSLFSVPSSISYKENVLGEMIPADIQTLMFVFAMKTPYGADVKQNMLNLTFFQEVTAWIMEQNTQRNLPRINEGVVRSIVPTLTAHPNEAGSDCAIYQIQIKMQYKRRG